MNERTFKTAPARSACLPAPDRKVLLVDDDALTREALSEVLRGWSFTTFTAATIHEAQSVVLNEGPFKVIISEYDLPDGNGLEFLNWLQWEMLIEVPFLLISEGVVREPNAFDDYEFLAMPFQMEEFRTHLERLCRVELEPAIAFNLTALQKAMSSVYARSKPAKK